MQGLDSVLFFQDDILVTAEDDYKHLKLLDEVFQRLHNYGLKVKMSKVTLFADTNLLYSHKNLKRLETTVNDELSKLYDWITANKLTLNA